MKHRLRLQTVLSFRLNKILKSIYSQSFRDVS